MTSVYKKKYIQPFQQLKKFFCNIEESNEGNIFSSVHCSFVHYFQITLTAFTVALFAIPFTYLLSLIPYGDFSNGPKNYYNRIAILCSFLLATTSFGPVYLGYVAFLMVGLKKMIRGKLFVSLCFHTLFWPLFYSLITVIANFDFWFYYLDFLWFLFAFIPISFHIGYWMLWNNKEENENKEENTEEIIECKEMPQSSTESLNESEHIVEKEIGSTFSITEKRQYFTFFGKCISKRMRLAIMFTLSEFIVIVSALGYTFFLFPFYISFENDAYKVLWRILLHPIWLELTMVFPQRLIALQELKSFGIWRVIPVMHSLFHAATIGRMLINNISSPTVAIIVTILTNIQEILFRLTAYKRDFLAFRAIYGKTPNEDLGDLHATVMNIEMIMEILAILVAPFLMYFFESYGIIFNWYSGKSNLGWLFGIMALQFLFEFPTDILCITFETRKFDLFGTWKKIRTPRFIIFLIYGYLSMSILGMIYVATKLPRGLFCSDHYDFCSCSYAMDAYCPSST